MRRSISDFLVISDLDNTLLTARDGIPDFNVSMIDRFQKFGGLFTVATGRTVDSVDRYLDRISLNCPAIVYNGGIIYDYRARKILDKKIMPDTAPKILANILASFPDVGCEIMCDNLRTYWIKQNEYTFNHLRDERMSYIISDMKSVTNKWVKVLFASSNGRLMEMKEFCESLETDDFEFVMTNDVYFEMMPKGVSKGKALGMLCALTGKSRANTIAVGDYYNDIEILSNAGLSVCVDNAPEEIKKICRIVVPSCREGGVGYLLQQIMDLYE